MAFDIRRFTRVSLAFNTGRISVVPVSTPELANGPAFYTYASDEDTIAEISAANYFNDEAVIYDLHVDDVILVIGDDANTFLQVMTVDTTTSPKTITTAPFTAAGVVDTGNIVDGAITNAKVDAAAGIEFSKLEALPAGEILVGSAGNEPTAVAMSGDATISNAGVVSLADSMIKYAEVDINAAAWNGMYVTPVQLVAAPGANLQVAVHRILFLLDYGTTQFQGGGNVFAQYGSTTLGAGTPATATIANTGINAAVADSTFQLGGAQAVATSASTVNQGVYLSNASGAFTTGDSVFKVAIWYSVGSFA